MIREPLRILIIDDNSNDIFLAKKAISKSGIVCTIREAFSGLDAFDIIKDGFSPQVILMDFKLPGISGIELIRYFRNNKNTSCLPIAILSCSNMESDIEQLYTAGATLFIHKAYDFEKFTESLKSFLTELLPAE